VITINGILFGALAGWAGGATFLAVFFARELHRERRRNINGWTARLQAKLIRDRRRWN
jgi:hypothetical protein